MRSIAFKIMVLTLALFLGSAFQAAKAQTKATQPEYKVIKSDAQKADPASDIACSYFMRSKDYTKDDRLVFSYTQQNGNETDDTPKLSYVTIVIDAAAVEPVAKQTGHDDAANAYWEIHVSQATYDEESHCLAGLKLKK